MPVEYNMKFEESFFWDYLNMKKEASDLGDEDYERSLDERLAKDPSNISLHISKSMIYQSSDPEKSLQVLEAGEKSCGRHYKFPHSKAMLLAKKGDFEKAIEFLYEAVKLEPCAKETLYTLGTLLKRVKRYDEALKVWDEVIKLDSEDPMAWHGRSSIEFYTKDLEKALKHINAALWCLDEKTVIWQHISTGSTFVKEKSLRGVRAGYLANRALIKLGMGDYSGAADDYESIMRDFPDEAGSAWRDEAMKLGGKDYGKGASVFLERLLEAEPDDEKSVMIYAVLAGSFAVQKKPMSEWIVSVGKVMNKSRSPVATLDRLAIYLMRMGAVEPALEVYKELVDRYGERLHAVNVCQIAQAMGDKSTYQKYEKLQDKKAMSKANKVFINPGKVEVGRNALCPCGSGKKFKKCCGKT